MKLSHIEAVFGANEPGDELYYMDVLGDSDDAGYMDSYVALECEFKRRVGEGQSADGEGDAILSFICKGPVIISKVGIGVLGDEVAFDRFIGGLKALVAASNAAGGDDDDD